MQYCAIYPILVYWCAGAVICGGCSSGGAGGTGAGGLDQVESLELACTAETQTDIGLVRGTDWEDQI